MLRHTITCVKGLRTMSNKRSEHVRHSQHAIKKSKVNVVAKVMTVRTSSDKTTSVVNRRQSQVKSSSFSFGRVPKCSS